MACGRSPRPLVGERQSFAGVGVLWRDLQAAEQQLYAPVELAEVKGDDR